MPTTLAALIGSASRWLPDPRIIFGRDGRGPYLSRWYLLGIDRRAEPGEGKEATSPMFARLPFNLFLHRFHRSDDEDALHSHPWKWAVSLVLSGGYSEERRDGDTVVRRDVRPLSLNWLKADTYHRVDLHSDESWSLFLVGPKSDTWYFWDRSRKARCQWRVYIDALRAGDLKSAPWVPDTREETD